MDAKTVADTVIELEATQKNCMKQREGEYLITNKRIDRLENRFWYLLIMMGAVLLTSLVQVGLVLVKK